MNTNPSAIFPIYRFPLFMRRNLLYWITAAITFSLLSSSATSRAQSVAFRLCPVGNPGNKADTTTYGAVTYNYNIGKFDVTLYQYAIFLNAVANNVDTYKLYNSGVAYSNTNYFIISAQPGIIQTGLPGNFVYRVVGDGSEPVTFVNWFAAARFCNWLHNGEPTRLGEVEGSTETGAYPLNGDTTSGLEIREPTARWWIPAESEWYKAAYYDPALHSGSGGYFLYATGSNTAPGNTIAGGSANQANYNNGVFSKTGSPVYNTLGDYLTAVGAFYNSPSYYGTFDQAGDVFDWNDAIINTTSSVSRGVRGGCWFSGTTAIASSNRGMSGAGTGASNSIGFRVATTYAAPTGVFEGLIDNAGVIAGIIRLKIDVAKQFTGDLNFDDKAYSIHGVLKSGTYSGTFGRSKLPLTLDLDGTNTGDCVVVGSVTGTSGTAEAFTAYHQTYGFARTAEERGTYSLSLTATSSDPTIPQTSGSATMSVANTGGILLGGKLPDGRRFRASNIIVLSPAQNQFLIHESLDYPDLVTRGQHGSLSGALSFQPTPDTISVNGTLEWSKPQQTKGPYQAAFDTGLIVTGTLR